MEFTCSICGTVKKAYTHNPKYCSRECFREGARRVKIEQRKSRPKVDRFIAEFESVYGRPGSQKEIDIYKKWKLGTKVFDVYQDAREYKPFIEEL